MADNLFYKDIAEEIKNCLGFIDENEIREAVKVISKSRRIFCAAAGRSALALRGFAMRLMHLGKEVYVVGETTTPPIKRGDLLLVGSGSGNTASLVSAGINAARVGAKIVLFTIDKKSKIAKLAKAVVIVPAPSPKVASKIDFKSSQPMGSLFEQTLFVLLDSIIMTLMEKEGITSSEMFKRHANLE